MKIVVISDVHANSCALEAIWEKEKTADIVVHAGDLVPAALHDSYLPGGVHITQGKLRGAFTENLITYYVTDKFYEFAASLDQKYGTKLLYARPVSLNERVARHAYTIQSIIQSFNEDAGCKSRVVKVTQLEGQLGTGGEYLGELIINGMPEYVDYIDNGVGYYLKDLA